MGSKMEGSSALAIRRDPYEVLCVSKDANDQEIKTAYRKLALKYVNFVLLPNHVVFFVVQDDDCDLFWSLGMTIHVYYLV